MIKITAICLFYLTLLSTSAYAADPFLSDSEEDGTYAEEVEKTKGKAEQSDQFSGALAELPTIDESAQQKSFRGTIETLLNKANPEPEEEKKAWTQFESIEGTEAENKFLESSEYKVREELSKPIQTKRSLSSNLDNIKNTIDSLGNKEPIELNKIDNRTDSFFEKTE